MLYITKFNGLEESKELCENAEMDVNCPEGFTTCNKEPFMFHKVIERDGHYYTVHIGKNTYTELSGNYRYSVFYAHNKTMFIQNESTYTWTYSNDDYDKVLTHLNSLLDNTPLVPPNFSL